MLISAACPAKNGDKKAARVIPSRRRDQPPSPKIAAAARRDIWEIIFARVVISARGQKGATVARAA